MLITIMMVALIAATMMMNTVKIDPREPFHDGLMGKFYHLGMEQKYESGKTRLLYGDKADAEMYRLAGKHKANWDKISKDMIDEYGYPLFLFQRTFMELLYQKPYPKITRGIDEPHEEYAKIVKEDIDYFCWMVEEQLAIKEKELNDSECICTPTRVCRKHNQRKFTIKAELGFQLEDLRKEKEVLLNSIIASIDERILDLDNKISLLPDVVEGYNVIDHPSNF